MGSIGQVMQPQAAWPLWQLIVATAAGAIYLWSRLSPSKLKTVGLRRVVELFPVDEKWRSLIEFVLFVGIGSYFAMMLSESTTPRQAIAAGFGWTTLLTRPGA